MRVSKMMKVVVNGYGMSSSLVAKWLDSETCRVTYVDEESDSQRVDVRPIAQYSSEYTVHACQCTPLPTEAKP